MMADEFDPYTLRERQVLRDAVPDNFWCRVVGMAVDNVLWRPRCRRSPARLMTERCKDKARAWFAARTTEGLALDPRIGARRVTCVPRKGIGAA